MATEKTTPSRRDFLKTSTTAATAGSLLSGLSAVQAAHTSYDETIRLGMIGCGGRCTGAANQAMNTEGPTKLIAMCDAFEDRLQGSLKTLDRQHKDKVDVPAERQFVGFDGYKQLLATDIDLVLIATPPGFRPIHFEAAVKAGKHIFAEKPVAVDAAGIRRFMKAVEESKKKDLLVQIGLQRRHEPAYKETIQRLQDGAIGDIVAARAYWNGAGVWTRNRQPGQTEMEYQMRNWYYFNWLCGDHINEQHIHNLDVETLHAQMPLDIENKTEETTDSIKKVLFGEPYKVSFPSEEKELIRTGKTTGQLVGGNLSVLYSILGSTSMTSPSTCITPTYCLNFMALWRR